MGKPGLVVVASAVNRWASQCRDECTIQATTTPRWIPAGIRSSHTGPCVVAVAMLIAACGGSDSDRSIEAPATEQGLLSRARANAEAFIEAPGKTYEFLSAACRESVSRSEWAGQMLLASSMFESFYGVAPDELKVTKVEVVSIEGETGSVAVTITGPDGESLDDESEADTWRYEDGRWVSDECETMGSDSSSEVSVETALAWPAKFCELREGMTRGEVRAIMGEPTTEFLDESSQDQYEAYQFSITIFYNAPRAQDPDPMMVRVQSLSPDPTGEFTEMTLEDVALFPCAEEVFDQATLDAARANTDG